MSLGFNRSVIHSTAASFLVAVASGLPLPSQLEADEIDFTPSARFESAPPSNPTPAPVVILDAPKVSSYSTNGNASSIVLELTALLSGGATGVKSQAGQAVTSRSASIEDLYRIFGSRDLPPSILQQFNSWQGSVELRVYPGGIVGVCGVDSFTSVGGNTLPQSTYTQINGSLANQAHQCIFNNGGNLISLNAGGSDTLFERCIAKARVNAANRLSQALQNCPEGRDNSSNPNCTTGEYGRILDEFRSSNGSIHLDDASVLQMTLDRLAGNYTGVCLG